MTSDPPYLADSFFITGVLILLLKFWTWEEVDLSTNRKTAAILSGVTIVAVVVCVGFCWLSGYLHLPHSAPLKPPPREVKLVDQLAVAERQEPPAHKGPDEQPRQSSRKEDGAVGTRSKSTAGTYTQQCIGSACAQGPGAQANFTQYGPRKLEMTETQRTAIRDAMKPYAGQKFEIFLNSPTEDSATFAEGLRRAFIDAGMVPSMLDGGSGISFTLQPNGVSAMVGREAVAALKTLSLTMIAVGLADKPIPATLNPSQPDQMFLTISPNR